MVVLLEDNEHAIMFQGCSETFHSDSLGYAPRRKRRGWKATRADSHRKLKATTQTASGDFVQSPK